MFYSISPLEFFNPISETKSELKMMNKDPSFSHSLYAINTLKDKIVLLLITHNKEKETEIPIIYYVLDLNLQKRKQR